MAFGPWMRPKVLQVRFASGDCYDYEGAASHLGPMIESPSPGSYLHKEVKTAKHKDGTAAHPHSKVS